MHGVNGASSGKSGKEKKRVKANSERPEVKRKRAHRQDAIEKKLLYENRTSEYGSGIGLDIGAPDTRSSRKKRAKRTECPRCKSKTHLSSNSLLCPFNKKKLAAAAPKGNSEEAKSADGLTNV